MRIFYVSVLAAALMALTGCDIGEFAGSARYQRDFHFSYPLNAGGKVSVEGFNGPVDVSGWDENTVDISGVKFAASQERVDSLRIDVDHSPDSVTVRAVRSSNAGREGTRFTIKVPRTAVLDRITTANGPINVRDGAGPARLRTSNAEIRVQSLAGDLDARTSNGRLELADIGGAAAVETSNASIRGSGLRGPFHGETSNGGIDLSMAANYSRNLRADTSNGSITVRIPGEPNAELSARTSNGSVRTDFSLKGGQTGRNRASGTLGGGGPLFELTTSNGSINLQRL